MPPSDYRGGEHVAANARARSPLAPMLSCNGYPEEPHTKKCDSIKAYGVSLSLDLENEAPRDFLSGSILFFSAAATCAALPAARQNPWMIQRFKKLKRCDGVTAITHGGCEANLVKQNRCGPVALV
jgi:hypothetical protein